MLRSGLNIESVLLQKLSVAFSDDATVRIRYLVTWCLARAMVKVKVTL